MLEQTSTITSLAILKVNFDRAGQDFIDNFVPFAVECLRGHTGPQNAASVRTQLTDGFGITIPQGAVESVLRRLARKGLARPAGNGRYVLSAEADALPDLMKSREAAARRGRALIDKLVAFSGEHLSVLWSPEEAEIALVSYAAQLGPRVLASREALFDVTPSGDAKDQQHLLGEFVLRLRDRDPAGFDELETLVKGALLASAMYYPDLGRIASRYENLDVYLDTRFVLQALGTAGPEHEAACRELLDLTFELGATSRLFESTLGEIVGVLNGVSRALQRPASLRSTSGESLEFLASSGWTSSDVELLIGKIRERLIALRISIRERPQVHASLTVDELAFESLLKEARSGQRPYPEDALRHDVGALTAIHRLRGGQSKAVLETSRAIFLTTNRLLSRISETFFREHYGTTGVPLCFTDYHFATLSWLKKPTAAPSLPALYVIADSYAALNPPDALWRAYLAEIGRLEANGQITAEDYYTLRFTTTAKSAIVDLAADGDTIAASVPEVLARAKAAIRDELERELKQQDESKQSGDSQVDAAASLAALRSETEANRGRRAAQIEALGVRAGRIAARAVFLIGAGVAAIAAFVGIAPFLPTTTGVVEDLKPIVVVPVIAIALLGFANLVFGTSIKSFSRDVEMRVSRRVIAEVSRRLG